MTALFALSALIGVVGLAFFDNPLITDEPIAGGVAINALIVAFALPAALTPGSADGSTKRRCGWRRSCGSSSTSAWKRRRIFVGEAIGGDRGFTDAEIYAYSAVWLALGLALLAYGVVRGSREARYASAFFIVATTLKVFLYDLAGLEGALRAFSFIGLGLALIAIGLVYQKLVFAPRRAADPPLSRAGLNGRRYRQTLRQSRCLQGQTLFHSPPAVPPVKHTRTSHDALGSQLV